MKSQKNEVKCAICEEVYGFMDDGTADCMPDGYCLPTGAWICDDCGSCPICGRTLEKEPNKRASREDGILCEAKPCKYCEEEIKCEVVDDG